VAGAALNQSDKVQTPTARGRKTLGRQYNDSLLADPARDQVVGRAWHGLGRSNASVQNVRSAVAASWLRCVDSRVDPHLKHAPTPLQATDFESLCVLNSEIIDASREIIKIARELLAGCGAALMLTDQNGVILDIDGDNRALNVLESLNMLPGANWSERCCGTNAIGTTLSLRLPVQIHGSEHFCESIKRFTCSASPIVDPWTDEILGVVNVSGFAKTYSPQTLILVVNAAHRIKQALENNLLAARYKFLDGLDTKLSFSIDRTELIFLDARGFPLKVAEEAQARLASLGIPKTQLNQKTFLSVARFSRDPTDLSKAELPSWINADWIDPVCDGDQHLGCVIRLPAASHRVRQSEGETDSACLKAFSDAKGESSSFKQAVNKACRIARSHVPVVLLGETGVGKEVFASGIHLACSDSKAPFVALNCGALSRDLLASELFGYVDGAFTGARRGGMTGKIETADGGTLFLDEIGEMPLDLQPMFLRVLEKREVVRLGESMPRKASFRLICATNRDLKREVAEGRFRNDLYYRLSVVTIKIPALRDRVGDPGLLAEHYLKTLCQIHGVPDRRFSEGAIRSLNSYSWPGNIRELRNIIESIVLSAPGPVIRQADVEAELSGGAESVCEVESCHLAGDLARSEFEQIKKALQRTLGNATQAARELGIAKSTLYLKVKKLGLSEFLDSQRTMIK
jgi:transcriptional regulator of acetoin/glycerol metabolism